MVLIIIIICDNIQPNRQNQDCIIVQIFHLYLLIKEESLKLYIE